MRESIGSSFLVNVIIVFVAVMMLLLVGSLSYSRTFKIKNKIIDIIEKYEGYNASAANEIEELLSNMGYKVNAYGKQKCDTSSGGEALNDYSSNYRYCVIEYSSSRGVYYGVTAYIYFEIPLLNNVLEFPIYGETKTFYDMTN
ncbi:MAG TPA: hypothetical protein GX747_03895 [Tenericutes bacterium]|nr:hypothetical protein [Mycoplasmatota bacterium]